ncbi:MAG TPA: type II toxin-antitoxin system HicB family antitoxin [Candidatus Ornithomonoglobus merdipullorum]|uniref:Type II toxin-antitoxin system HicB family antitoxin n=1 Tax=Candidatus Ornithomonoglobus merdipullorum TaxID=2840895 RepID=A0A9D1MCV7_9FIRM|nr:type II toxin-antitoxin system HicB family antitoxin [Candidatus Ornithomonoglobus merdipullorum]
MKEAYPIIMSQGKEFVVVYVPDFNINTQGRDIADAMEMARDAIGIIGIDMEDDHEKLPSPSELSQVKAGDGEFVTLVDVDFEEYRRKNEMRSVKKNCTIPGWLNYEAEKANINFSNVLQKALMEQLHITR